MNEEQMLKAVADKYEMPIDKVLVIWTVMNDILNDICNWNCVPLDKKIKHLIELIESRF